MHYVFNPDHYIGIVIANTTLLYNYDMVYRQLLYFHRTPSQVHHAMYTVGAVDIYHVINRLNMALACQFCH
jgi:hypothetical protein